MIEFPVSEHYKKHVLDGDTITKRGVWWTAVLLIADPKTGKPFIGLYRWQSKDNSWKLRKRFTFRKKEEVASITGVIQKFSHKLPE
jgi:hypothetical protein